MNFALIYSKQDKAGINIAECLKEYYLPHIPVIETKKDSIYLENIDKEEPKLKNADFIIFATKHQSKEKIPSLSVHAPGNWRNADFGGKPGKICKTSSLVLKFIFQRLNENSKSIKTEHKITLECTHHGPLIEKPCLFIEIGSSEESWENKELGKIIAKTIYELQNFEEWKEKNKIKIAVGIGGPHYCPNFNKIQVSENSNIAIGHIIPEYQIPLTESMLKEAIEKTQENIDLILLDWKGCGNSESRQSIIQLIEKLGFNYERTEKVEK